ncbi:MAG: DUF3604 domain-containing protein [Halioglobus sp.]|nr:DUF3604 domain-containing protein [Halioglobus sp.]
MQHKGSPSACRVPTVSVASDELCDFELLPWSERIGANIPMLREPPQPRHGFMREVLRDGFRHKDRLGFNPFKTGFIGSTDSHRAIPGGTDENSFTGHNGQGYRETPEPQGLPDVWAFNPGGLAVSLGGTEQPRIPVRRHAAPQEAYATSGPRMTVRFFGAEELPGDLCSRNDLVEVGYERGVPMGGDLRGIQSPAFVVAASRDAGTAEHPGAPLQQVQIIKGWAGRGRALPRARRHRRRRSGQRRRRRYRDLSPTGTGLRQPVRGMAG